jgi:glycosyltransferase involved in cell wall biosynthesis
VFLPSKLIEYVGAARPVIGLTPPGTAADLIERLGGWVADPKDVNEVARVMREYLLFLRERRTDPFAEWGRREVREEFEAETVATEFQRVLMELV